MHRTPAGQHGYTVSDRLVGAHAAVRAFGHLELFLEVAVELVENVFPVALALGHIVEVLFHTGGEAVVHQVREALGPVLGNDVTHLLRIETTVVQRHITAVLDGGDDRRVGRRTTDAALFHLLDQAGFGVTSRWLGEMLGRIKLDRASSRRPGPCPAGRRHPRLGDLRHDAGIAVRTSGCGPWRAARSRRHRR